jgi:tyrosinase
MGVRRNVLGDAAALKAFIDGVTALKRRPVPIQPSDLGIPLTAGASDDQLSVWDMFVLWHWHAMTTATGGGRNGAHRGPVFLPWHRWFLLALEAQMQAELDDPDFALPYWDWASDGDGTPAQQKASAVWTEGVMGRSDGSGEVVDGAFSSGSGFLVRLDYTRVQGLFVTPSRGLRRELGVRVTTLPTSQQVRAVVEGQTIYDRSPWSSSSPSGFRNLVEGNLAFVQGPIVAELHNRVHVWVGADMTPPTSPNDPVFYLNHCNVDRLWASWQDKHPEAGYEPVTGDETLAFHRLDDPMFRPFWWSDEDPAVQPRDMLDVADRYTYDTL